MKTFEEEKSVTRNIKNNNQGYQSLPHFLPNALIKYSTPDTFAWLVYILYSSALVSVLPIHFWKSHSRLNSSALVL